MDSSSHRFFWKYWVIRWESMTGFNIWEENHIPESILFSFPRHMWWCHCHKWLYPICKTFYLFEEKKLQDNNKKSGSNVDLGGYLCHLKYTLEIEKYLYEQKANNSNTYVQWSIWKPIICCMQVQNGICKCVLWQNSIKYQYLWIKKA